MAAPNFMRRISFLDGQILHDFHLNIMQRNIAESIKEKVVKERYDMLLMTSNYDYYFCDPLVNETFKDPSSSAKLNFLTFSAHEGNWISPLLKLPEVTDEIYVYASFEDFPLSNAFIDFHYRISKESPWIQIRPDEAIPVGVNGTQYVQLMIQCRYSGNIRPTLYDYAIFSRKLM